MGVAVGFRGSGPPSRRFGGFPWLAAGPAHSQPPRPLLSELNALNPFAVFRPAAPTLQEEGAVVTELVLPVGADAAARGRTAFKLMDPCCLVSRRLRLAGRAP